MTNHGMIAATAGICRPLILWLVLGLVWAGVGYAQPGEVVPVRTTPAADVGNEDELLWQRLDITEDGWLDGKELEGGWKKFDSDGNTEVTKAEFMAGRVKERPSSGVGSPAEDVTLFKQLDISKNGLLSGTELAAGDVRTYDANSDGRVTEKEFLDARARLRPGAVKSASPATAVAAAPATVTAPVPESSRYKPGDKIWYKKSSYPLLWEEGVFVNLSYNGTGAIIRQKPNEFFKDGFESGARWADIRPINERPLTQAELDANTVIAAEKNGTGLMTQTDVLDFLRTRLGLKSVSNPETDQIKKELALMIKRRGVDFRYETGGEFATQSRQYGTSSEITFSLQYNYGPPTKQSWLMGTWTLSKISAAVDYVVKDKILRDTEFAVGNVGVLTLNADSTYDWKSVTAQSTTGKWRKATSEEMKHQGGDGVVLLKAKSDWDWIVMQNRGTTLKDDWIAISELSSRQIRETGSRKSGGR